MPGLTAWVGLQDIGTPKAGETLVVSAASGAVGQVAGQLGRIAGCRVVGIAGGAAKCAFVKDELGFDAAVDHRGTLDEQLDAACPGASTSTGRTSAARCRRRSSRASTISGAW